MSKEISLPNNRVIELNWNMCQLIFLILKILHNGQFFLSFLFPFFQLYFSSLFIIILKIFRNGIHGYFLKTALIKKQSENLKVGRWNVFTCKTFSFIYVYIDICTLQRKHFCMRCSLNGSHLNIVTLFLGAVGAKGGQLTMTCRNIGFVLSE